MPYYVIQVFSSKEEETAKRIKRDLVKLVDEIDIFVPKRKRIIKKEGIKKERIDILFPGYIFIKTDEITIIDLKKSLYQVKTLTKVLGIDKDHKNFIAPLTLAEEEMLNVLLGKDNPSKTIEISHIYLKEGRDIVVVDGPLKGQEGKIVDINLHKRRVTVRLEFMGRLVDTDLGIDFIAEKIDTTN
ncbi:antiterminator LoaP [bacterium]|nr:antiterminator LoaP [bacterium]